MGTISTRHVEFDLPSKNDYMFKMWKPATDARRVAVEMIYAMLTDEDKDLKPGSSITIDIRIGVENGTNSST